VIDQTGCGHNHPARHVLLVVIRADGLAVKGQQVLFGAENAPTQRMFREQRLVEEVICDRTGLIICPAEFIKDDLTLGLDVGLFKVRATRQIREDLKRRALAFGDQVRLIDGVFRRGERVDIAAEPFDLFADLISIEPLGPFEDEVFKKVRCTLHRRWFVPRPHIDPNAKSSRQRQRGPLSYDERSPFKACYADASLRLRHRFGLR
jgi:hypothetical protein